MHILAINGSSRPESTNGAVLRAVAGHVRDSVRINAYNELDRIPPFDPAVPDGATPSAVRVFRRSVAAADGVLITTPEYAHSMPGTLKNALDWLVGSGELANKPVAIITASTTPTGGLRAQAALIQTLLAQSAEIVVLLPISGSRLKIDPDGNVHHQPTIRRIHETVLALIECCSERV